MADFQDPKNLTLRYFKLKGIDVPVYRSKTANKFFIPEIVVWGLLGVEDESDWIYYMSAPDVIPNYHISPSFYTDFTLFSNNDILYLLDEVYFLKLLKSQIKQGNDFALDIASELADTAFTRAFAEVAR